jgi:hypothetical protein
MQKKYAVQFVQPESFRRLALERAKSNRIAEIQEKIRKHRVVSEIVDKFDTAEMSEEVVLLNTGQKAVLFSLRDSDADGVYVLQSELDNNQVTRKQVFDNLMFGTTCQS